MSLFMQSDAILFILIYSPFYMCVCARALLITTWPNLYGRKYLYFNTATSQNWKHLTFHHTNLDSFEMSPCLLNSFCVVVVKLLGYQISIHVGTKDQLQLRSRIGILFYQFPDTRVDLLYASLAYIPSDSVHKVRPRSHPCVSSQHIWEFMNRIIIITFI